MSEEYGGWRRTYQSNVNNLFLTVGINEQTRRRFLTRYRQATCVRGRQK